MDATAEPVDSGKAFFNRVAWGSFLVPLVTAAVTFLLLFTNNQVSNQIAENYLCWAFWTQAVGVVLGIVSLFGIPKYGARRILWKAALGILLSCGLAFFIFVLACAGAMGNHC